MASELIIKNINFQKFPKLYMKIWWPLFSTMKFTFLFLNLAKIHIFIPKSTEGGGGGVYTGLEIFLKRKLTASLTLMLMWTADGCDEVAGGVWQ